MARNEQLIRQHRLLQILERSRFGQTLNEIRDDLVDELGLTSLHTRTVRRDLEALQAAGIDIVDDEVQRGRVWKFGPMAKGAHKITASSTELIALSLGRDLLFPLAGTPFWLGIESFWSKVQEELPPAVWSHYEDYRQILKVLGTPAKSYAEHHGIMKTLNRAMLEHRVVEIEYQSLSKPLATRRIEPYSVVFYQSSLYIIAAAHEVSAGAEDRIRHWKLDRFKKATALDLWYKPEKDFDLDEYVSASMGIFSGEQAREFVIRVSNYAARWIREDPWHPEQKIEEQPDGGITLTVKASHDLEIIPRVLALGSEAELISPEGAREKMATMIRDMSKQYQE